MTTTFYIQNLKCGGCEATIKDRLTSIADINQITVNHEDSSILIDHSTKTVLETVKATLSKLGYPLLGMPNTLPSKAKSYVSCAIGRIKG